MGGVKVKCLTIKHSYYQSLIEICKELIKLRIPHVVLITDLSIRCPVFSPCPGCSQFVSNPISIAKRHKNVAAADTNTFMNYAWLGTNSLRYFALVSATAAVVFYGAAAAAAVESLAK